MVPILEEISDNYLEVVGLLSEEEFKEDVNKMKSTEAEPQYRKEAQERVWTAAKKSGELIVHGDIGIVEVMESAKNLRDQAVTLYEQLQFPKLTRVGLFHIMLNKMIQDVQRRMLVDASVNDVLSLAFLKTNCNIGFLTNNEDAIKVLILLSIA